MKKLLILVLLSSCRYPLKDEYIKTKDGKIYKLKAAQCDNCYHLELVDTSAIRTIMKK